MDALLHRPFPCLCLKDGRFGDCLRGAFCDPRAGGCRTTNPNPLRKDAVKLVEGIVTASPEFFELADDDKVREFFDDAYRFCCDEFGESNMVHFTVHMDEETPHAHFGFVPLRDGKLSWKEFFPNKMALGKMQDRFYGRVGALYGLSRGEKRGDGEPVKPAQVRGRIQGRAPPYTG